MITISYVMDFEILVLNNYKRRAMSQVLQLRGNDGHWETDLEYYRTVTFIVMTMHYDRNAPNSPYRQIIRFHYYNRNNLIWCDYNNV